MSGVDLAPIREQVAVLDLVLRDIVERPVDPGWMNMPPAVEQAGVAAEATAALTALLDAYETDDTSREEVRRIFRAHRSFRWAVGLPQEWSSTAEFRRHLLHLSARDQADDTRDELMALWHVCAQARRHGLAVEPVLREVAALSSDEDRFGMGSMRSLILRGAEHH